MGALGMRRVRRGSLAHFLGVLVVILPALLGACSGGDAGEGANGAGSGDGAADEGTSSSGQTSSSGPSPGADPGESGLALDVGWAPTPARSNQDVVWRLVVTNRGAEAVEIVFNTGKDGDVRLSREGAVVYTWSDDRVFTQVVRTERLDAGASRTYELQGPLAVPPGTYELEAALEATPAPPPARTVVEVGA